MDLWPVIYFWFKNRQCSITSFGLVRQAQFVLLREPIIVIRLHYPNFVRSDHKLMFFFFSKRNNLSRNLHNESGPTLNNNPTKSGPIWVKKPSTPWHWCGRKKFELKKEATDVFIVKIYILNDKPTKSGPIWVKKPSTPWHWCGRRKLAGWKFEL